MDERLAAIKSKLAQVAELDLSHQTRLGEENGFLDLNKKKTEVIDRIRTAIDTMEPIFANIPEPLVAAEMTRMQTDIDRFAEIAGRAADTAARGTGDPQFRTSRKELLRSVVTSKFEVEGEAHEKFIWELRLIQMDERVKQLDLDRKMREIAKLEEALGAQSSKFEQIINVAQDKVSRVSIASSQSTFTNRSSTHRKWELGWLGVVVLASAMTVWAAVHVIFEPIVVTAPAAAVTVQQPARAGGTGVVDSLAQAPVLAFVGVILRRVLMLALPLLFLRIALIKYNAERHLHIIYDHRVAALDQLKLMLESIGDEHIKSEIRAEVAKMILGDPATGYSPSSDAPEVNINPVFSMLEKAVPGGGK